MSSLISSSRKYRISFSCLVYVIIVVSFRIVTMSWFHSRENSFRFLQWSVTTTRHLSNGTIEPVSSLKSISTVWNSFCNRGQYCIGSNTRLVISPSLPSTGTILNNGTWASPTILDSTNGQYTYREFNPFLTSTTQSETYSPAGNIACLNPNMDCIKGLMITWQSLFTFISILWLILLKPMSNLFLSSFMCFFPSMGNPFGRGIVPIR